MAFLGRIVAAGAFCLALAATQPAGAGGILDAPLMEDAYISEANRDSSYLDDEKLYVAGFPTTTDNVYKSYLSFDLTGIDLQLVHAAQLILTLDDGFGDKAAATNNFTVYGIWDENRDNWTDAGSNFTWNSALSPLPVTQLGYANRDNNTLRMASLVEVGTFQVSGKGTAGTQYVITGLDLMDFLLMDTDNSVSFIIKRGSNANKDYVHAFASSESSSWDGPILRLDLAPEPTSLVLMGTGLAGLWYRSRRRRFDSAD